jgi:Protein of unknown function (DUF3107)
MEIRIGVVHTPKEISLEVDGEPAELTSRIEEAVSGGTPFVWLEDSKGRKVGVPADKIAYVEFTVNDPDHKVGFGR